jgi:catechol 2,3-dioxygenase-like lactoylglutathione lyase family enzyme
MKYGTASLGHVVLFCFDFHKMKDFYTDVLGFHLSDSGQARGNDICFMTLDPARDHHMLALASGRTGSREDRVINHISFRVPSLADLRMRYELLKKAGVKDLETITHGSWLSVYYRDIENNRLEFFCDTPWYVQQPVVKPLDLSMSDDEIMRMTVEDFGKNPEFKPMTEWKSETTKSFSS